MKYMEEETKHSRSHLLEFPHYRTLRKGFITFAWAKVWTSTNFLIITYIAILLWTN